VVECRHRVHAVVLERGRQVAVAGDPRLVTFLRSCAKPIQALPLARLPLSLRWEEIAVACASHQAERAQLAAVRSLLARAEASEDDLECGFQEGRPRRRIAHNCSGKHAGFLLVCRERGWPWAGYILPDHPLQRVVRAEVAAAAGLGRHEPTLAGDGCGAPTFALSLQNMAAVFSRLSGLDGGAVVVEAMRARPDLVGGRGALDTALMRALPGWVAKRGAEGLLCAASGDGLGIAVKVEDGNPRALPAAVATLVKGLGLELPDELASVPVLDSRGRTVGEVVVA